MTRRTFALLLTLVTLLTVALVSVDPARAARPHDVTPAQLDATALKLPDAALPTGAQVVHSAVSDNPDAQGTTKPADGDASVFGLAHGGPASYASEGRLTGYRMDVHYQVNGTDVRTAYLASVYSSAAQAQSAYNDVTGQFALIHIIGAKPLPDACTSGEKCDAEYFVSPLDATREAVIGVFLRGPVLVETASDAPAAQFTSIETAWETDIFALLHAADLQVQSALSGSPPPPPGGTSTSTATTVPATNTPTTVPATAIPTAAPTNTPQPLFARVAVGHGKIKAGKKQTITVTTVPGAGVTIVVIFPNGKKLHRGETIARNGKITWHFIQPKHATKGKNRTVRVRVTVSFGGETHKANKKYKIS